MHARQCRGLSLSAHALMRCQARQHTKHDHMIPFMYDEAQLSMAAGRQRGVMRPLHPDKILGILSVCSQAHSKACQHKQNP